MADQKVSAPPRNGRAVDHGTQSRPRPSQERRPDGSRLLLALTLAAARQHSQEPTSERAQISAQIAEFLYLRARDVVKAARPRLRLRVAKAANVSRLVWFVSGRHAGSVLRESTRVEVENSVRLDLADISDVQLRYATGTDSHDWELFRTCFTDEVEVDFSEGFGQPVVRVNGDD